MSYVKIVRMHVPKLYCYVDESGQDTIGKIFVVSIVVTERNRDEILTLCKQLEEVSGKRKDKWGKSTHDRRMRYIRHIFADDRLKGCLRYMVFRQTKDYDSSTITAIATAVKWKNSHKKYTSLIYIDGLKKTKRHEYGARLRHLGISVRRIRGILKDETNALTRLADAIAGFVRDSQGKKSQQIKSLFQKVRHEGMLIEITP